MSLPSALPIFDATVNVDLARRLHRSTDPVTSQLAAEKAAHATARSQQAVLSALDSGPSTDEQIEARCQFFSGSRLRTARRELMDMDPPKVRACGVELNTRGNRCQRFEKL